MTLKLFITVILIILSAIFSGTETAFTSLSLIQKKELEERKGSKAKNANYLASHPDLLLTTILIGNNIVNISVSALVTSFTIEYLGNAYVGYATGILTLLILIFGEITPKQIAIIHNIKIAIEMAIPIRILTILLFPLVIIFKSLSNEISKAFSRGKKKKETSLEGIRHIVDTAEDEGVLDEYESGLMEKVLHFSETQVRTIMTHRSEVFRLNEDTPLSDALAKIVDSGFSRIPLYRDSLDDITGIIRVRDVLRAIVDNKEEEPIKLYARKPLFVPETLHIDDLFLEFQRSKQQMAFIIDEYGSFAGIICMEDVVEQLFGEMYDEHETEKPEPIRPLSRSVQGEKWFMVEAETPLLRFTDELNLEFPEDQEDKGETVAAYLMNESEKLLQKNDVIETSLGRFRVVRTKGRRVLSVIFVQKVDEE
ncbi:MAG: hemolysin family protein [Sphaerochaetaceae bacterium]|nr:hemolysin family protein [Sphaerochaetaceae bacterium]